MKTARLTLLIGVLMSVCVASGQDITAGTPPAGFFAVTARGASDSLISLPLVRRSEFMGRVAGVSSSSIEVADAAWTADAFAPSSGVAYYVQVVSGNLRGVNYRILGNTSNTLNLETVGDDLLAHPLGVIATGPSGDSVRLRPYWTVGSVFGAAEPEVMIAPVASLNGAVYTEADQLLIYDNNTLGCERPAETVLSFVSGIGWRSASAPGTDAATTEIRPGTALLLRRQSALPVQLVIIGYVPQEPVGTRIPALAAGESTDVYVGLAYPATKSLSSTSLQQVVFRSDSSDSASDLLLNHTGARSGFRMPPEIKLLRTTAGWQTGDLNADDLLLFPGAGYVLRLRDARAATHWIQLPPN